MGPPPRRSDGTSLSKIRRRLYIRASTEWSTCVSGSSKVLASWIASTTRDVARTGDRVGSVLRSCNRPTAEAPDRRKDACRSTYLSTEIPRKSLTCSTVETWSSTRRCLRSPLLWTELTPCSSPLYQTRLHSRSFEWRILRRPTDRTLLRRRRVMCMNPKT